MSDPAKLIREADHDVQTVFLQTKDDDLQLCAARAHEHLKQALDALRWRKWPEEKPEKNAEYIILWCYLNRYPRQIEISIETFNIATSKFEDWEDDAIFYWCPIWPFPNNEEDRERIAGRRTKTTLCCFKPPEEE